MIFFKAFSVFFLSYLLIDEVVRGFSLRAVSKINNINFAKSNKSGNFKRDLTYNQALLIVICRSRFLDLIRTMISRQKKLRLNRNSRSSRGRPSYFTRWPLLFHNLGGFRKVNSLFNHVHLCNIGHWFGAVYICLFFLLNCLIEICSQKDKSSNGFHEAQNNCCN